MKYYGLKGIAISSVISEIYCSIIYLNFLYKKRYLNIKINNYFRNCFKILKSGIFIQIRNMCLKLLNILLIKQILFYDIQGVELASYIISNKMIDLGIVSYFGIGTIGYTMVPANTKNKEAYIKLMNWYAPNTTKKFDLIMERSNLL